MSSTEACLVEFVRWWCHLSTEDGSQFLTDTFVFDSGLGDIDREEFLSAWGHSGRIEDLRIVEVWSSDDRGTAMFEGTDEITLLRHRSCWMMTFDGDRVARVRATFGPASTGHR